ncbi:MAG: right-handed parallel beta-helix repeat-containing protein [Alphaproteobacteria bacterium]|nr:right-handed parallel beta-helix repeat-containing protein [Alphaproteobacteria bacterium]
MRPVTKTLSILGSLALVAALAAFPVLAQTGEPYNGGYSTWTPGDDGRRERGPRRPRGPELINVTPGGEAGSINDALERIAPGGTIVLAPGIYREDVTIEKSVNIRGTRRGEARSEIQPSSGGACLYVSPDVLGAVTVSDVTFRMTALYGSVPCVVVAGGVFSLKNSRVIARDNVPGVLLQGGLVHIEESQIEGGRFGILVEPSAPNSGDFYIISNTITRNGTGLRVQGPGSVNAIGNSIISNDGDGMMLFRAGGTYIANEIGSNGANGIVLNEGSQNPRFVSNRISGNAYAGIYIPLGGAGIISRNEVIANGEKGIRCEQGPCPTLDNNVLKDNKGDEPERRRGGLFD